MKSSFKLIIIALFICCLVYLLYIIHGCPKIGVDDANIFFSYAENFSKGLGMTYGANMEPVEGFTSMLWMLLCSGLFFIKIGEWGVLALTCVLMLTSQWISIKTLKHIQCAKHQRLVIAIYLLLLLSSPSYLTWTTITLMDTSLWGMFVIAGGYFVVKPPKSKKDAICFLILNALAPIARPEAMLVVPVVLTLVCVRSADRKYIYMGALIFAVVMIILTAFRMLYFGYPLPNTYYAKVSPSIMYNLDRGQDYLFKYVMSSPIVAVGLLVFMIIGAKYAVRITMLKSWNCWLSQLRDNMDPLTALATYGVCLLFLPVLNGGDHFKMFRFYQPVYPIICVGLAAWIVRLRIWGVRDVAKQSLLFKWLRSIYVCVVVIVWLVFFAGTPSWNSIRDLSPIDHEFRHAERSLKQGQILSELFSTMVKKPSVGVIVAGGIARSYPGRIEDLMGLNNLVMAHSKGDRVGHKNHAAFEKDAFFAIRPDIVLAVPPIYPRTNNNYSVWLKDLHLDYRFTSNWRFGMIHQPHSGREIAAYVHKDLIESSMTEAGLKFMDLMLWDGQWVSVKDKVADLLVEDRNAR